MPEVLHLPPILLQTLQLGFSMQAGLTQLLCCVLQPLFPVFENRLS